VLICGALIIYISIDTSNLSHLKKIELTGIEPGLLPRWLMFKQGTGNWRGYWLLKPKLGIVMAINSLNTGIRYTVVSNSFVRF
jgi:hypothetical protein